MRRYCIFSGGVFYFEPPCIPNSLYVLVMAVAQSRSGGVAIWHRLPVLLMMYFSWWVMWHRRRKYHVSQHDLPRGSTGAKRSLMSTIAVFFSRTTSFVSAQCSSPAWTCLLNTSCSHKENINISRIAKLQPILVKSLLSVDHDPVVYRNKTTIEQIIYHFKWVLYVPHFSASPCEVE